MQQQVEPCLVAWLCMLQSECALICHNGCRYRDAFHKAPALLGKLKHMGAGSAARRRSNAYVDPRDIEGCEALLESHFTQVGEANCVGPFGVPNYLGDLHYAEKTPD